ncbi:MAG TPA: hypothetical protein VFC78_18435 [Tepidisphaeraceae bacterium]|nr:hypothetical protein [Tepidisphaeraceae bacterium]
MLSVDSAIHRVRRDITLGVMVKGVLLGAVLACLMFAHPSIRFLALTGVIGVWIALSMTSARTSRLAIDSPSLIAAGQFDEAEQHIDQAMRGFSLFSAVKLQSLHQLAMLRHAQRRWQESAALSSALLGQRLGATRGLSKASRMILAESLLEMNELGGAYGAIYGLYGEQLSLNEVLVLLAVQLDYESKIGAWHKMFSSAAAKVQLAELMPSHQAARVQALLALAALKVGRPDWARWLADRAQLLADVDKLTGERPILGELWNKPSEAQV